jgi:uncharacterized protein YbbC (DUF1343 family)
MRVPIINLIFCTFVLFVSCSGQTTVNHSLKFITQDDVRVGAQRTEAWFPLIKGKRIGLVANQTSLIGRVHIADSLLAAGFDLVRVFGPEHGFRGEQEAGKDIGSGKDVKTGLSVISLYGKHKKPFPEDLQGIDVMIYDIQDVGVRFFTFISTMSYVMEACAENNIPLIILDRPDPNGFYVDGPVLDTNFRSFVGLHPVPIVYGMTAGEYAKMVNGEGWLAKRISCQLIIVTVEGYDHNMVYKLPVKPSPNLPDWQSVYLYPTLGLFEGTIMSVGRGTDRPFRIFGHPNFVIGNYIFRPRSIPGVSEHPPYEGQDCFGGDASGFAENIMKNEHHFTISYLIYARQVFPDSMNFFNAYFDKLSGSPVLREQLLQGMDEGSIRQSWQKEVEKFLAIRSRYLLYPDFK